jgi:hypothetical protein
MQNKETELRGSGIEVISLLRRKERSKSIYLVHRYRVVSHSTDNSVTYFAVLYTVGDVFYCRRLLEMYSGIFQNKGK